jgi:hypothetical protein
MHALYLLTRAQVSSRPGTPVVTAPSVEPLLEIRPGAFARWMAQVEADAAAAEAQAARGGFATNEGIAATRPDALPEPT